MTVGRSSDGRSSRGEVQSTDHLHDPHGAAELACATRPGAGQLAADGRDGGRPIEPCRCA